MRTFLTEQEEIISLLEARNIRSRKFDGGIVEVVGEAARKYPRQVFIKDFKEAYYFIDQHNKV